MKSGLPEVFTYDAIVVGGGLSGVCAAIAAARGGVKTALVQNRPVLGGNASSEIRMHICGADNHGHRANARETGILEEILLENKYRNPQESYSMFDTILWEKVYDEENIDLYLNTHMTGVTMDDHGSAIKSVICHQLTSERHLELVGTNFVDTTGDGTLAYLAGADCMSGREGKSVFDEAHAPEETDKICMGNTLLFKTKNMGRPMPFIKPTWANTYTEEDLQGRDHGATGFNYWWIELGGDELDTIRDSEILRTELTKAVFGVWDHIKNGGDHQADNYALDWIGFLPGKRESRRVVGDYVLTENDLAQARTFDDTVAFGGWPMDMHIPGGLRNRLAPTEFIHTPDVYGIPYRSLCAKSVDNLMIGGRVISASHMAFGSIRVMGTCAVIGQAIGTALRLLKTYQLQPSALGSHMDELQQTLLREDAYLPGVSAEDLDDLATNADVSASSFVEGSEPSSVVNGIARTVHKDSNCWMAANGDEAPWLSLKFEQAMPVTSVEIKFDSDLSSQIMMSMFDNGREDHVDGLPPVLIKDYSVVLCHQGNEMKRLDINNNYRRFNIHTTSETLCDEVRIECQNTHGSKDFRIYEVRVY